MTDLGPQALAQMAEAERDAIQAFRRWKRKRRARASRWIVLAIGFAAGAGLMALLIAALRWVP